MFTGWVSRFPSFCAIVLLGYSRVLRFTLASNLQVISAKEKKCGNFSPRFCTFGRAFCKRCILYHFSPTHFLCTHLHKI